MRLPRLSVRYPDPLSLYHEYHDIFDTRIYHFQAIRKDPVIVDAGGYIGLASLYFKSVYPSASITVFEPDEKLCRYLELNLRENSVADVRVVNAGLGTQEVEATFYSDGADGGSVFVGASPADTFARARIVRLSSYIDGAVDLLKMNVEGSEYGVFQDIEPKLHLVREIIFEYHAFASLPQTLGQILTILDGAGFRYLVTDATNAKITVPFSLHADYRCFNLVYARRVDAS